MSWVLEHIVCCRGGATCLSNFAPQLFARPKRFYLLAWPRKMPMGMTKSVSWYDHFILYYCSYGTRDLWCETASCIRAPVNARYDIETVFLHTPLLYWSGGATWPEGGILVLAPWEKRWILGLNAPKKGEVWDVVLWNWFNCCHRTSALDDRHPSIITNNRRPTSPHPATITAEKTSPHLTTFRDRVVSFRVGIPPPLQPLHCSPCLPCKFDNYFPIQP